LAPGPPPALRDLPLRHLVGSPTPDRTERDRVLEALTSKSPRPIPLRYVTVTQIVDPRQAYWDIMAPEVELTLEQVERMEAGSVFHDRFAHVVTAEPFREQRVDREGVRGKIDIYEKNPVELKTTSRMPEDLARERPGYLLQLLFYCALVGVDRGYVVVVSRSSPGVRGFDAMRVWKVDVSDLDAVWREAQRRKELLMEAVETRDPSGLPPCGWFGAGCSFQGACDCAAEPGEDEAAFLRLAAVTRDPEEEARLGALLMTNGAAAWKPDKRETPELAPPLKLRDFPFARKRMLEHLAELEGGSAEQEPPRPGWEPPTTTEGKLKEISASAASSGMRKRVLRALGVEWTHVRRGAIDDRWVAAVGGEPVKFKVARLTSPVDRTEIIRMFPDEVGEIGAAGTLLGAKKGRLVLYYERVADERQRLLIYEIPIRDAEAFARAVDDAAKAWAAAWEARDASRLPPCPRWAVERCEFGERCPCRR
jgi:hypothetical protein